MNANLHCNNNYCCMPTSNVTEYRLISGNIIVIVIPEQPNIDNIIGSIDIITARRLVHIVNRRLETNRLFRRLTD